MTSSMVKPGISSKGAVFVTLAGAGALLLGVVIYIATAGGFDVLGLLAFVRVYVGVLLAAAVGIAGFALLLIGTIAIGVRLALKSVDIPVGSGRD